MWSKEEIKQFCAALRDCSHYSNLDEEDIEEVLDLVECLQNKVERLTSLANYSTGKLDVLESWKLTAEELAKEVAQLEIENSHLKEEIADLSNKLKESEKECQKLVQVFLEGIQEGDA